MSNVTIVPMPPPRNWLIEVQKGNVPGTTIVHKFGRNQAVPNASFAFVNLLGLTAWPLSAATTVRVKAGGNAADDTAGNGAREITIEGLDGTGAAISEAVATAGASASSATAASYLRVHRAFVSAAGTYGTANTAAVTIENSAGGTDLIQIATEEGQSQFGGYSIPLAKTGYFLGVHIMVDSNKPADLAFYQRRDITDTTAPLASKRLLFYFDGTAGHMTFKPQTPSAPLPALTDIWWEAQGSGAGTEVSVDFEILLVDD